MNKLYFTSKTEFEKYFKEHPDFPQDLYEVLFEQIHLAELNGYTWIIQESDETKPVGVIFDAYDNEDENKTTAIYLYDDFL